MDTAVWRYGGGRWPLDLLDADGAARYAAAVGWLAAEEAAARARGEALSAGHPARLAGFFDRLLGDGAGAALMAPGLRAAMLCHADFYAFVARQVLDTRRMMTDALSRHGVICDG